MLGLTQILRRLFPWFAWYSMNPETLVIPGPGEVPQNLSPNLPGKATADCRASLCRADPPTTVGPGRAERMDFGAHTEKKNKRTLFA